MWKCRWHSRIDFDPFGRQLYRYTFDARCKEDTGLSLKDGSHSVFLSTKGRNADEVPKELKKFLEFVGADIRESEEDFEDSFVAQLQESIRRIKDDREIGERYMIFEEMLREERSEGKAEGKADAILELLSDLGGISEELRRRIIGEKNQQMLNQMLRAAASADSMDMFTEKINYIFKKI